MPEAPVPELLVSNAYHHTVSELYTERLEGRITEQEFGQRLDQAYEEEAKKQEHFGPLLMKRVLKDIEKDISEKRKKALDEKNQQETLKQIRQKKRELDEKDELSKKEREEKRAKERKEREEREEQEAELKKREEERKEFREKTAESISERDVSARNLRSQYNTLQVILLVFSAVTATMAGIDGVARAWVAVTGVIATIAGGILTTFKIQDRIYANHKAVAELRLECQKYDYRIEDYKGISPEDAFVKFSRIVNGIQGEQMLQEVELWNPKRDESKKAKQDKEAGASANQTPTQTQASEEPASEVAEEQDTEDVVDDSAGTEVQPEGVPGSSAPAMLNGH